MTKKKALGPWQLAMGYDYRFGTVALRIHREGEEPVQFVLTLAQFLRHCRIHPDELRAHMADAQSDRPCTVQDIEQTRLDVLTETDFRGKVVLDVGGYNGFAAEIAHKGGAARAVCLDNHQYEHYGWDDKKLPGVEYVRGDFMNLAGQWSQGYQPDVIIFYNVLYHLRAPWTALDHLRALLKPGGEMLLCTLFRYSDRPNWYLYEPGECNPEDRTVYWAPSISGLERLLTQTGWTFHQEGIALDRVVYRCRPVPGFVPDLAAEGYAAS